MLVCMVYGCVLTLTPHFLRALTWRGCRECLHRTRSCCWQARYWDCETFPGSLFAECRIVETVPCTLSPHDGWRHEMHYVHSCSSHSQCSHQHWVSQGSAHNVSFVSLWCQQAVWDNGSVMSGIFIQGTHFRGRCVLGWYHFIDNWKGEK